MKNIFRKFVTVILIFGIFVMPIMIPAQARAATTNLLDQTSGCGFKNIIGINLFPCLIQVVDYVAYGAVYYVVGWFTGIAGNLLSFTLGMTINNKYYTNIPAVSAGWAFSRDIVNILFIFALLLIAISTILGIESYGAKSLLARFIIIALLVNFSLLATQAIIFVTNALANELYNAVGASNRSELLTYAEGQYNKDISGALMASLFQQKIFTSNPQTTNPGQLAASARANKATVNLTVLITIVASAFIMIFAAFIFVVGSFFFVSRMATLWLLMVLAPFGFVFLILPATKSYAQKWWTTLQSQALFAPAFMFFILLTIKMSQGDPIGLATKIRNSNGLPTTDLLFLVILQNLIIFLFLGGGLYIAKILGIYGADGAMKMATRAGTAFRGYAGRVAGRNLIARPASFAENKLGLGGALKSIAASRIPIARGLAESMSRGLKTATNTGGMDKLAEKHSAFLKTLSPAQAAKRFSSYSEQMQQMIASGITPRIMAEMQGAAEKGGDKDAADAIERAIEKLPTDTREKYYDERAKVDLKGPIEDMISRWANIAPQVKKAIIENSNKEQMQKISRGFDKAARGDEFVTDVNTLRPDRINDALSVLPYFAAAAGKTLQESVAEIDFSKILESHLTTHPAVMDEVANNAKPKDIRVIMDRGDQVTNEYLNRIWAMDTTGHKNATNIAVELRVRGNAGTAAWVESAPGKRLLDLN